LLVEGEERLLRPWDFFHCPAGTEHVFVGAGDGPCVILMAGARSEDEQLLYPVSELAGRYGASAERETPDPKEARAVERPRPGRPPTGIGSPGASGSLGDIPRLQDVPPKSTSLVSTVPAFRPGAVW
jgi:hypothetical protein